jgi:hypothetical protein
VPRHQELTDRQFLILILERLFEMSEASDRATASLATLNTKVDTLIATAQASNQDATFTALADSADAEAAKIDAAFPTGAQQGEQGV